MLQRHGIAPDGLHQEGHSSRRRSVLSRTGAKVRPLLKDQIAGGGINLAVVNPERPLGMIRVECKLGSRRHGKERDDTADQALTAAGAAPSVSIARTARVCTRVVNFLLFGARGFIPVESSP